MTESIILNESSSQRVGFGAVLRSPAFCVLWFSEAVSLIGDRILMIALINYVFELTASAAAVGLLSVLKALPALVLGTLAGVLVDRWSRKWTMVISNLLLFAMVLTIPIIDRLPMLFAVYFGMSVVSQFFIPARAAAIPTMVPQAALMAANSLFAMAFVGAIAIGPAIGGWIMEQYSTETAFYVDALTFLVPAIAVSFLVIPKTQRIDEKHSLGADWREGLGVIGTQPMIRNALLLIGAVALLIASLSTLGVIIIRERLSGSAGDFGVMMSITGLGMLGSAIGATWLGKRFNRQNLSIFGSLLAGAAMIGVALFTSLALVMASGFFLGMGFICVQINSQTTLQMVPDRLRGRVLGLAQTMMGSVTFLAAGMAGVLATWLSPTTVLVGAGMLAACTGLVVMALTRRSSGVQKDTTNINGG